MAGYSPEELDAIEGWMREGLAASAIAGEFFGRFRRAVTRNAIIGIIHRSKRLSAVATETGWSRPKKRGGAVRPPRKRAPSGTKALVVHPGNLRGKRESRRLDPDLRPIVRALDARDYDARSAHKSLVALKHNECRWPVNDAGPGRPHLFCAAQTNGLRSYCDHHAARAVGLGTVGERRAEREVLIQTRDERRVAERTGMGAR